MLVMLSEILRPPRFPVLFQMPFLRFLGGLGILDILNIITQGMTGGADFFGRSSLCRTDHCMTTFPPLVGAIQHWWADKQKLYWVNKVRILSSDLQSTNCHSYLQLWAMAYLQFTLHQMRYHPYVPMSCILMYIHTY